MLLCKDYVTVNSKLHMDVMGSGSDAAKPHAAAHKTVTFTSAPGEI